MEPGEIAFKTEAGLQVVQSRSGALSLKQRSLLIMADGKRSVADLRAAAQTLGLSDDSLEGLLAQGLIECRAAKPTAVVKAPPPPPPAPPPPPPAPSAPVAPNPETERFLSLQRAMLQLAVENLGLRSFLFTLKIEKCNAIDDLRALLVELTLSLRKAKGDETASRLLAPLQAALSDPESSQA